MNPMEIQKDKRQSNFRGRRWVMSGKLLLMPATSGVLSCNRYGKYRPRTEFNRGGHDRRRLKVQIVSDRLVRLFRDTQQYGGSGYVLVDASEFKTSFISRNDADSAGCSSAAHLMEILSIYPKQSKQHNYNGSATSIERLEHSYALRNRLKRMRANFSGRNEALSSETRCL